MATIFDVATSADQLSPALGEAYQLPVAASAGKIFEPQIARMTRDLAAVYQPQIARMTRDLATIYQPQIAASVGKIFEPLLTDLLALEDLELTSPNISMVLSAGDQRLRKLSDREVAAMLTVAAFLFVYFSLGLLVKYSTQVAEIAATDGPTPFEAAMAIGALVFWLRMNHSRRTKGK